MKKWLFVVAFLTCSLLFFLSGTLVGYLSYDKQLQTRYDEKEKSPRKVSKTLDPIIGTIVDKKTIGLKSKARVPTHPAIQKAEQYKTMIHGHAP